MHTFLRHTLATLAYRAGKTMRDVPGRFATFHAGHGVRTPLELVSHMADLVAWAHSIARGEAQWEASEPERWEDESARFHEALAAFDAWLAQGHSLGASAERLLQGPLADALTHTGQLAMLRRLAGYPMGGESYFAAEITIGRVGPDQAAPGRTF